MTTETQEQGWAAAFGVGLTPRDFFAMFASEADIQAHTHGPKEEKVVEDFGGRKRVVYASLQRTREQARYAFADSMMAERAK